MVVGILCMIIQVWLVTRGAHTSTFAFIIWLDYILQMSIDLMKENSQTLKKARNRQSPAQTFTDVDYADDIVLLAITSAQIEHLLHSLEWAAGSISHHVNADKTEDMCFNPSGNITTLNGRSQKLVDKFIYLRSCVLSTKNGINTQAKVWTAINRLLVIWKSDLSDKFKRHFFQAVVVSILLYRYNHLDTDKVYQEKGCYKLYQTNSGSQILQNSSCMATYHPSWRPSNLDKQDMLDTVAGVRTNS